jgi:hypothetical protein
LTIVSALVVLLGPGMAPPAGAAKSDEELRKERADVLAKKAEKAKEVNALESDDAKVSASLDALTNNVTAQSAAMLKADAAAKRAREAAERAKAEEAQALGAVRAAEDGMRQAAVQSYTRGATRVLQVQGGEDINDISRARAYGAVATGRRTDALDRLEAARKDLEAASKRRKAAAAVAEKQLANAQARVAALNKAKAEQLGYAEQVSARLDKTLSEAEALAGVDAQLSAEITKREAALAAKLAAQPSPRGGGGPISVIGEGGIVSVRGIQVARSIAGQLAAMLAAADGAGISLSGGGYRSSAAQIQTRRNNGCPDVYNSPASACSPPTARPGQSMHEQGLAIDFQCSGVLIRSRSSPCFVWLNGNAGRFGFRNLPSEPWHWSTNGR